MKKMFLLLLIASTYWSSFAQTQNVKDLYFDFSTYRTSNDDKEGQIAKMQTLLKSADQLTPKQITNVNYHLGRLHEEVQKPEQAIPYYETALKGEPNYFVIHRALGFIYLSQSKPIVDQIKASVQAKDIEGNQKANAAYKLIVLKALPYLEKYQACDPDEQTLTIITNLYKSIKQEDKLASLETRLKSLSTTCVSLLEDE